MTKYLLPALSALVLASGAFAEETAMELRAKAPPQQLIDGAGRLGHTCVAFSVLWYRQAVASGDQEQLGNAVSQGAACLIDCLSFATEETADACFDAGLRLTIDEPNFDRAVMGEVAIREAR